MIYIEQGQVIPENEKLMVSSPSGNYGDNTLIEFYHVDNRDLIIGTYQAQFIRYGSMVYKFNDVKELGEAILDVDPESSHTAASYVRMMNELNGKMDEGSLESESLDEIISNEKEKMEEKIIKDPIIEDPVVEDPVIDEPVIADPIIEDPVIDEPVIVDPIIEDPVIDEPVIVDPVIDDSEIEILPENSIESESEPLEKTVSILRNKKKKRIV